MQYENLIASVIRKACSMLLTLLILLISSILEVYPAPRPIEEPPSKNCGYQSCHPIKEGYINVHIIPHTRDLGWLRTVNQQDDGSDSRITQAEVNYILDSVVDALRKDKNRRFSNVDTEFFWKWWIKRHDTVKAHVRRLVNDGQLEFASGGWSVTDEAITNYQSVIEKLRWGLRKLNDSFGECGRPKVGWQVGPFGQSRLMAAIFAPLGFDGVLLERLDYEEMSNRLSTKRAKMVWRSSQDLGSATDTFTIVINNTHSPRSGSCFDILDTDEPVTDGRKRANYNVDQMVNDLFEYVKNMTEVYATNNIIVTRDDECKNKYRDMEAWLKNLDKLIYYANLRQVNGSKYNLLYSTPSCYVKAVHDETKEKNTSVLKVPYESDLRTFRIGFYTSRSTIKRFERERNNFLQVCKELYALTNLGPENRVNLNVSTEAMDIMQYHYTITGTEKQHVDSYDDYARLQSKAIGECEFITASALSRIVAPSEKKLLPNKPVPPIPFTTCPLLNISQCEFSETSNSFVVTVYNPLSRPVTQFVRLPISGSTYSVRDVNGTQLITQLIPIAKSIRNVPGRNSTATAELIFRATDVPPLGFKSLFVEKIDENIVIEPGEQANWRVDSQLDLDPATGVISMMYMNLSQQFYYYKEFGVAKKYSTGYTYPNRTAYKVADKANTEMYKGVLVVEVHQQFNDWISQIIRLYANENIVEFDWLIDPSLLHDTKVKEVVTQYTSKLRLYSMFFTDSNGKKRVRNLSRGFLAQHVSNSYPVTSRFRIRYDDYQMDIVTDRPQGIASFDEMELLLYRNCLHDDAFCVNESLAEAFNKTQVVRGSHYVILGSTAPINTDGRTIAAQQPHLAQRKLLDAWTFLSPTNDLSYEEYKVRYLMEFSGMKRALPDNVQILSLKPWIGFSFRLKLQHILEKNEDPTLSRSVTVNLKDLFSSFKIVSLRDTDLEAIKANQWKSESHKLQAPEHNESLQIRLDPMQIRTFIIEIAKTS